MRAFRFFLIAELLLHSASSLASGSVVYSYDALGQLIESHITAGVNANNDTHIAYDRAGNRSCYGATVSVVNVLCPTIVAPQNNGYATISIAAAPVITSGVPLSYTVTKTGTTSQSYSVNFSTANGSAVAGVDYTAISGTLLFAAGGSSAQPISVPTISQNAVGVKTVLVNLASSTGGVILANNQATGVINYVPGSPTFSITDAASVTSGSPITFMITKTGQTSHTYSTNYMTVNGTAIAGTDYTATTGVLDFGAGGDASQKITVLTTSEAGSGSKFLSVTINPIVDSLVYNSQGMGTISYVPGSGTGTPTIPGSYALTVTSGARPGFSGYAGTANSLSPTSVGGGYIITEISGAGTITTDACFAIASTTGGAAVSNGGWTSINIPGSGTYARSTASYSTLADTLGRQTAKWCFSNPSSSFVTTGTVIIN